ncbi:MAG: DUF5610 domain-containing protein [Candidatus Riflebacteria bacterium]|nr:DUF5610 domain-containing protein [Candidatus Riflebacteria bacterium]
MVEKIQLVPTSLSGAEKAKNTGKSDSKNELFKNLNVDQFGLSSDARNKVLWARSQFELNYQVLKSVNSSQGFETTQETFSFKGSYEFLQRASGGETVFAEETTGDAAVEGAAAEDQLTQLQDYFSPENTAQRILDVATSFFAISETGTAGGNNEASRQKFADFIGGAINEGFKQARDILGDLPEDVESGINKTNSLVFTGLADFVKNGINLEKSRPGGVFDKIAAYREEAKAQLASSSKSSSTISYNSSGSVQTTSNETPKISTKG